MTRAIDVPASGHGRLFGIRFATGGLFPLLGAPLSLLTDRAAAVADLPARRWRPPLEGWWSDPDFRARCARADASLVAVLPRLPGSDLAPLLQALGHGTALPSVAGMAQATGLGLRSLQRRFLEQVGVSPKQHLCYLRFERARQWLARPGAHAADVALAAGYSDQAHLVREFRRFTGTTPGRLR
jgi:AraC-like DNA-binding protein